MAGERVVEVEIADIEVVSRSRNGQRAQIIVTRIGPQTGKKIPTTRHVHRRGKAWVWTGFTKGEDGRRRLAVEVYKLPT